MIDEQCARALGRDPELNYHTGVVEYPPYSTNAVFAKHLENRIAELNQGENYIIALSKQCGVTLYHRNELPLTASWMLLRATPEQRAAAFLYVMERLPL